MTNKIYVANLPYPASEFDLKKVFSKVGLVSKITVIKDARGRSKGYGFVEMSNQTEAKNAVNQLNGYTLNVDRAERNLYVTYAQ